MTSKSLMLKNDLLTAVDANYGLVLDVVEHVTSREDPDVHVTATRIPDFSALGLPREACSTGSGAALTLGDSAAAAVGEVLERYACANIPTRELTISNMKDLQNTGEQVLPLDHWNTYSAKEVAKLPNLTEFLSDTVMAWTTMDCLTARRQLMVPACLVYMPYVRQATEDEQLIAYATSTGVACAPTSASAVLHGLCEVIERDAFMIGWRRGVAWPRICIDGLSTLAKVFQRRFARPGLQYHLFLTQLDLPVCSVFGVLVDDCQEGNPVTVCAGAANRRPEKAVLKTLCELAQGLAWISTMQVPRPGDTPPFDGGYSFDNIRTFEDRVRLYAFRDMASAFEFTASNVDAAPVNLSDLEHAGSPPDLAEVVVSLGALGLDVLAKDITTVDVGECGVHVVRVIVPQAEYMEGDIRQQSFAGTRWRAVPDRLGVPMSYSVSSPNPYPHPYP